MIRHAIARVLTEGKSYRDYSKNNKLSLDSIQTNGIERQINSVNEDVFCNELTTATEFIVL